VWHKGSLDKRYLKHADIILTKNQKNVRASDTVIIYIGSKEIIRTIQLGIMRWHTGSRAQRKKCGIMRHVEIRSAEFRISGKDLFAQAKGGGYGAGIR
jgi:hypothetical protein